MQWQWSHTSTLVLNTRVETGDSSGPTPSITSRLTTVLDSWVLICPLLPSLTLRSDKDPQVKIKLCKKTGEPYWWNHIREKRDPLSLPWSPLALQELDQQELGKDSFPQSLLEQIPLILAQTFLPAPLVQVPVQALPLAQALPLQLSLPGVPQCHCYYTAAQKAGKRGGIVFILLLVISSATYAIQKSGTWYLRGRTRPNKATLHKDPNFALVHYKAAKKKIQSLHVQSNSILISADQ